MATRIADVEVFDAVFSRWEQNHQQGSDEVLQRRELLGVMRRLRGRFGDHTHLDGICKLLRDTRSQVVEVCTDLNDAYDQKPTGAFGRVLQQWSGNHSAPVELIWTCLQQMDQEAGAEPLVSMLLGLAELAMAYQVELQSTARIMARQSQFPQRDVGSLEGGGSQIRQSA